MSHSLHLLLRLCLLCLALPISLSLVTTVLKPKNDNGKRSWRWPGSLTRLLGTITLGGKVNPARDMLLFALGFASCMILVKFQTISADNMRPSEIRYDWLVLKQRTPLHIAVYQGFDPARYEIDLCHPLGDKSAAAGHKMEWIRFRRENGCLDVIAHQYYSDEFTGERLLFPVKEEANVR